MCKLQPVTSLLVPEMLAPDEVQLISHVLAECFTSVMQNEKVGQGFKNRPNNNFPP